MMNRGDRLRRAALVLALLVLAAILTGVAASAATTAVPNQLTGKWRRGGTVLDIDPLGLGGIESGLDRFDLVFERVAAHRLGVSGEPSCSGTGIYRWKLANRKLKFTKVHDTCMSRVAWLVGTWSRPTATSATKTVVPKRLTGSWYPQDGVTEMGVSPVGKVEIYDLRVFQARFSRVTALRLTISGASCSGTGTYRWKVANHGDVLHEPGHEFKLKKIHDACKPRVDLFAGRWFKPA